MGNIIAGNGALTYKPGIVHKIEWSSNYPMWQLVFMTWACGSQTINRHLYEDEQKRQIDVTGYSWEDLAKIEWAFETAPKGKSEDEWMFNGLCAVIDVLDKIHENTDEALTTSQKARFAKA